MADDRQNKGVSAPQDTAKPADDPASHGTAPADRSEDKKADGPAADAASSTSQPASQPASRPQLPTHFRGMPKQWEKNRGQ